MLKPSAKVGADDANRTRTRKGQLVATSAQPRDHLDDLFEAHLAACQRRSAQKMLEDFENAGIDEDLEHLKASWAPSFGQRTARAQPRKSAAEELCVHSSPLQMRFHEHAEMSGLALQAGIAKERQNQLAALRSYAGTDKEGVDAGNHSASRRKYDNEVARTTSRRLSNLHEFVDDPWNAWEERWSQEFEQFEEFERATLSQRAAEIAASQSRKEAEWKHRARQAGLRAEDAARKRREGKPCPDKPQAQTTTGRPNSQASRDSERTEAPKKEQQTPEVKSNSMPRLGRPGVSGTPASRKVDHMSFSCFDDFDGAWKKFDAHVGTKQAVRYTDIPWPTCLPSISGVEPKDTVAERKKKLRAALIRWHPDKWGAIFDLVSDCDKAMVMERVKEVTRRIIEEKTMYGV